METGQRRGVRGQARGARSARLWLGLSWAIALLVVGCTPSKRAQCNQLAKAVNAMQPIAEQMQAERQKFTQNEKTARASNRFDAVKQSAAAAAAGFTPLMQKLDPLIQDLQAVKLQDPTLVDLQTRYVQNVQVIRTSLETMTTAFTTISTLEPNPTGLMNLRRAAQQMAIAEQQMKTAIQTDQQLVTEFNQYCEIKP